MIDRIATAWSALRQDLAGQGVSLPELRMVRVRTTRRRLDGPGALSRELNAWLQSAPAGGWVRFQSRVHAFVAHEPFSAAPADGLPLYGEIAWAARSVRFRPDGRGGIIVVETVEGSGEDAIPALAVDREVAAADPTLGRARYRLYRAVPGGEVRLVAWRLRGFAGGRTP